MDTLRPLILIGLFTACLCALFMGLQHLLGPRRTNSVKMMPFECGNVPLSKPKGRFSVKFYTFAMLFIIFDIELMFLFPWAVVFRKLGAAAFIEMLIFLGIVGIGFLYAWRKGALEWD